MKKTLQFLLGSALILVSSGHIFAQSNHTVTFSGSTSDFNASEKYSAAANSTDYYITFDANYLYIGAFRTAGSFSSTDNLAIYLDTDPDATLTGGTGTPAGQNYNSVSGTLPFTANYDCHIEESIQEMRSYASSWASTLTVNTDYFVQTSSTAREIKILLSSIGSPNSLYITMWMGNNGSFFSNVPGSDISSSGNPAITEYFGGFGVSSADCIPVNITDIPITDIVTDGVPVSGALYGKVVVTTGTVTASNDFNVAPGGSIQVSGGTLDISGRTIQMGGTTIGDGFGTTINTSGSGILTTDGSSSITFNGEGANTGNDMALDGLVVTNRKFTPLALGGTTIVGTLQINVNGYINTNSCSYASGSNLNFANNINYQVLTTDKTWATGSSGPGVPYNVAVVGSSTSLTISDPRSLTGDLTITDGSLTLNSLSGPDFNVGGNWTRTGSTSSFNPNSVAKVIFNGSSSQTITCNAGSTTETFELLEIANTGSAGNNLVSLGSSTNVVATASLILTQGVLTTGTNQVQLPTTCTLSAGGGNTNYTLSWINGNLRRYFTGGSSATWDFPVGDANYGRLAQVVSNGLTGISYFDSYFRPLANGSNSELTAVETTFPGNPYHTAYTSINNAGTWVIEPDAQPTGSTTYDVQLYFNGFAGLTDNTFGILKRPITSTTFADFKTYGGTINATGGAGRLVSDGYSLRMGLGTFSEFGIGESDGTVLPITLSSFSGKNDENVNLLSWTTASELNTNYFAVEKSIDCQHFEEIGKVNANGFSVKELLYNFTDDAPFAGVNYYRLRSVDLNSSFEYSNIIALNVNNLPAGNISFFPNPCIGDIHLNINSGAAQKLTYIVSDVMGRTIQNGSMDANKGINFYTLSSSQWTEGSYFINILDELSGAERTIHLIKTK